MRAIKTILVPTDFSAASDRALRYARDLADAVGASLHVLHVLENPFPPGTFMETYSPSTDNYLGNIERQARARLEALLTDEQKAKYSAVQVMRRGMAAEQILEVPQRAPRRSRRDGNGRPRRVVTADDRQRRRQDRARGAVPGADGASARYRDRDQNPCRVNDGSWSGDM